MSETHSDQFDQPLGVGAIVGDSFSILFRNFLPVLILAFLPTLLGMIVSGMMIGWRPTLDASAPAGGGVMPIVVNVLIQIVVYGLTVALLVQAAYDAKLGRRMQPTRYIGPALRAAVPIAVLSVVVGILGGLASIALILPGLWVYSVFSVMPPAVVIEESGFGGLGRSARLTKGYRWPVLGALVLVGICGAIFDYVANFIVAAVIGTAGADNILLPLILIAAIGSIGVGLGGIAVALIYARLREIKEGIGVADIAAVFD